MARRRKTTTRRRVSRRRAGLTFLELMLAISGTALIGSAIVSMLYAVSYGTQADKDLRSLVTKQMALRTRVSGAVRESAVVLQQGAGYLFLWHNDTDESGTPHLDEITLIEFDGLANELNAYRAPAAPSSNPEYALADDFSTVIASLKGTADFPAQRWASDIAAFDISLDDPTAQSARLVSFRLTLTTGDEQDTAVGAAALRDTGAP